MTDPADLVQRLRDRLDCDDVILGDYNLWGAAADAIEALTRERDEARTEMVKWANEAAKANLHGDRSRAALRMVEWVGENDSRYVCPWCECINPAQFPDGVTPSGDKANCGAAPIVGSEPGLGGGAHGVQRRGLR